VSLAATIYGQFRKPRGMLGRLAGWIMANRGSNRTRNAWTIALLDLKPEDRFLEIGFGPGLSLQMAAEKITSGRIVGIDHSAAMTRMAAARNAGAIREGRMELTTSGLDLLEDVDTPFTKVMSANVVQFWEDGEGAFRAIADTMAPGGRIATTYQPRHKGATSSDAFRIAARITAWMYTAGFCEITVERLPLEPLPAICVTGIKR
jgi:cyclopropane fatty-acyl-phospholipid synthase-like methyltransferase